MTTWQKIHQHPALWEQYLLRERVIRAIRQFFIGQKFREIDPPLLITHPAAESYLEVFQTTLYDHYRNSQPMFLSTSPETALKKLLVAGIGNCFALTKSFRNMETGGPLHHPEFTMLEWYRAGVDYRETMQDCEQLLLFIKRFISNKTRQKTATREIVYQGQTLDLTPPWERLSVREAFKRYAQFDLAQALTRPALHKLAKHRGYRVEQKTTWEELFNQIYLNEVEPRLGQGKPTIIYDFPLELAALARKKAGDPRWAERFEFYLAGLELGDGYSELTDWKEQEKRFKREITKIKRLGKTVYDYDHDFIEALKVGLPECSGVAVGVDRLVMLFGNRKDIAETLFFPIKETSALRKDY